MTVVCILLGITGVLASTVLFPLVGMLLPHRRPNALVEDGEKRIRMLLFIPAAPGCHEALRATLLSLSKVEWKSSVEVSIQVAVDGEDSTIRKIAKAFKVEVSERPVSKGKWNVLRRASYRSDRYDWIGLIDVGTLLEPSFGSQIQPELLKVSNAALFPTYQQKNSSPVSRLLWNIERFMKKLENISGGTISSHGAMVLYRGEIFSKCFAFTGDREFLNDDVVLPLLVRLLSPFQVNRYLPNIAVIDSDISLQNTWPRRKRLMVGNLQWMKEYLSLVCSRSPRLLTVVLRRVFRTFWAYWVGLLLLSLGLVAPELFLLGAAAASFLLFLSPAIRDLSLAFRASLESPFRLVFLRGRYQWK